MSIVSIIPGGLGSPTFGPRPSSSRGSREMQRGLRHVIPLVTESRPGCLAGNHIDPGQFPRIWVIPVHGTSSLLTGQFFNSRQNSNHRCQIVRTNIPVDRPPLRAIDSLTAGSLCRSQALHDAVFPVDRVIGIAM